MDVSKRSHLAALIDRFPCLFGDTPTRTHVVEHDIDIGDWEYMLENDIAEPSGLITIRDFVLTFVRLIM